MCNDLVVVKRVKIPEKGTVAEILGVCPGCGHSRFQQNGTYKTKDGKKKMYICKACGKQSNLDPDNRTIPEEIQKIVDNLFTEGLTVALVHQATGISRSWLYARHKQITTPE